MTNRKNENRIYIALLLCFLQMAGIDVYAQHPVDSLARDTILDPHMLAVELPVPPVDSVALDSISNINRINLAHLDSITNPQITFLSADSIVPVSKIPRTWIPDPVRATWLAVVFPGAGQIYNRKFWKLPIIYGGFVGCAYALSWNNMMFKDYSQAYVDIMDDNPNTNSHLDMLPPNTTINESNVTFWSDRLKRQKDYYRRYRDISVFAFIGVYILSIIDAYVDAELSNFDISPDLSLRPAVINNQNNLYGGSRSNAIGLQCSFTF